VKAAPPTCPFAIEEGETLPVWWPTAVWLRRTFLGLIAAVRSLLARASGAGVVKVPAHQLPALIATFRRSALAFYAALPNARAVALRIGNHGFESLRSLVPFRTLLVIKDVELAREILVHKGLERGVEYRVISEVVGDALVAIEGAHHRAVRLALARSFTPIAVEKLRPIIRAEIQTLLAGWRTQSTVDVGTEMKRLSLRVAARGLFGIALTPEDEDGVDRALHFLEEAAFAHLFEPTAFRRMRFLRNAQFRSQREFLETLGHRIMAAQEHLPPERQTDFMNSLFTARVACSRADPGAVSTGSNRFERPLSRLEILAEILDFLLGGHLTTAITMGFMLSRVADLPSLQAALRAGNAELLDATWNETLRLYPAVVTLPRRALSDLEVGGVHIPQGTLVLCSPFDAHRSRPGSAQFDPARQLREAPPSIAFGHGRHACIGRYLASLEALEVLEAVVGAYELSTSVKAEEVEGRVLLRPTCELRVGLAPLSRSAATPLPAAAIVSTQIAQRYESETRRSS
jgi:cytochrome P450